MKIEERNKGKQRNPEKKGKRKRKKMMQMVKTEIIKHRKKFRTEVATVLGRSINLVREASQSYVSQ